MYADDSIQSSESLRTWGENYDFESQNILPYYEFRNLKNGKTYKIAELEKYAEIYFRVINEDKSIEKYRL